MLTIQKEDTPFAYPTEGTVAYLIASSRFSCWLATSWGRGAYPSAEHSFCPDVSNHRITSSRACFFAVSEICSGISSHVKLAIG
jgi:hypothetical protein